MGNRGINWKSKKLKIFNNFFLILGFLTLYFQSSCFADHFDISLVPNALKDKGEIQFSKKTKWPPYKIKTQISQELLGTTGVILKIIFCSLFLTRGTFLV